MSTAELHTLTGAYALHALPEDERVAFERHLGACEACAQEVRELSATAARLGLAERFGATALDGGPGGAAEHVLALTGGVGADAVLLTLASQSDAPVHDAAAMSRKRGRLVLVALPRADAARVASASLSEQVAITLR